MLSLHATVIVLAASTGLSEGSETPAMRTEVSVDWAEVSDTFLLRCHLDGLETLLLQGLVDEGFAVVRNAGPSGIRVRLREEPNALVLDARGFDQHDERRIHVPEKCESSLQLDVVYHLVAAAKRVNEARPSVQTQLVQPADAPEADPLDAPSFATPKWNIALGTELVASARVFAHFHVERKIVSAGRLSIAANVALAMTRVSAITITEPMLGFRALWDAQLTDAFAFRTGVGLVLSAHTFLGDNRDGSRLDGRAELPMTLVWRPYGLGVQAAPYVRRTAVEHQVRGETVFATGHVGVALLLYAELD